MSQDRNANAALSITQPEGRFIVFEGLQKYKNWGIRNQIFIPFTELVFDSRRTEVEIINEDMEATSYQLRSFGNGVYRLDSLYELRYNTNAMSWTLHELGSEASALVLEKITLPDTARMSGVSGFKYRFQKDFIAGIYHVANKEGVFDTTQTIAFAPDGQLIGVKELQRYNCIVNGDMAESDLMPIQFYNRADSPAMLVGYEASADGMTLWKLKNSAGKDEKPYYVKGELYGRLKKTRMSSDAGQ